MIQRYLNWRTILVLVAIGIIGGTVWYSRYLAKKIETEEQQRVQEWINASKLQMVSSETEALNLVSLINENNKDIPLIGTDEKDSIFDIRNIDSANLKTNPDYFKEKLEEFKSQHPPIIYELSKDPYIANKVYYGNTSLLSEVRYYPIVQLIIVAFFIIIALSLLVTRNKSTQNQVWAGMAKETAHQMGTPLSSLQGWVEMLREVKGAETIVPEMEKDVDRLKLVSDRFGKIGSTPQLVETNLTQQIIQMQEYMRRRASGKVEIIFKKPADDVIALISPPLFDWVLENLLKNALDAMEGRGKLTIELTETVTSSIIDVTDTGKGISSANIKNVFKPGFTTKKRGWGLGLTLSKRIMQQYHKGELYVKHSEQGKGTTFRIVVNK
ncbi:MAG: HAMP domain-containing sensor histidine kinase [Chitinophagaceae bacterium]